MRRLLAAAPLLAAFAALGGCTSLKPLERNQRVEQTLALEYYTIAGEYAALSKYDKAIPYYQLAMKDKKLYNAAQYHLGRAYALNKNWREAEEVFSALLKKDPDNTALGASIAYVSAMSLADEVVDAEAVDLPKDFAYVTAMSGKLGKASELYRKLAESRPQDETIQADYMRVLAAHGKRKLVQERFQLFAETFPASELLDEMKKLTEKPKSDKGAAAKDGEAAETEDAGGNESAEAKDAADKGGDPDVITLEPDEYADSEGTGYPDE
jgi:tetratricopeptide (TPR) repeat protein